MAEFKRVDTAPEKLKENECVILKPDFQEFIEVTRKRRGTSGLTTASNLRDIFMSITDKYDHEVNPYQLKLSKYEGIAYENEDGLRKVIFRVIKDFDLGLVEKALDYEIKNRKPNTDLIYYVSDDLTGNGAFIRNGINQLMDTKKAKVTQ